jgi:FMN-dependent NADH-azoreductase
MDYNKEISISFDDAEKISSRLAEAISNRYKDSTKSKRIQLMEFYNSYLAGMEFALLQDNLNESNINVIKKEVLLLKQFLKDLEYIG